MNIFLHNMANKYSLWLVVLLSNLAFTQDIPPPPGLTHFVVSFANVQATANTIEMDVTLTLDHTSGSRLSAVSVGVNYNAGILNGGTPCTTANCGSWEYIGGKSQELANLITTTNIAYGPQDYGHLRIIGSPLSGVDAVDIASGTYVLGRYRYTNTTDWTAGSNAQLSFVASNLDGFSATLVTAYPYGQSTSCYTYSTSLPSVASPGVSFSYTADAPYSLLLNNQICATEISTVVTNPSCYNTADGSVVVQLTPQPSNSTINYTINNGEPISATLSDGAFTITGLLAGDYTLSISDTGCSDLTTTFAVVQPSLLNHEVALTNCGEYIWPVTGQTYTTSGTYTGQTTNENGCIVNEVLQLTINPLNLFYVDNDLDGFGSSTEVYLCSLTAPEGYTTNNTDCDDNNVNSTIGNRFYLDADQDGYGSTIEAYLCSLTAPEGYATNNTDCDDTNSQVWQTATFYVDLDGDGYVNGFADVCFGNSLPLGYTDMPIGDDCDDSNALLQDFKQFFYVDADGDGYGSSVSVEICTYSDGTVPPGYALNNSDCDDSNSLVWQTGSFYVDADGDSFGAAELVSLCYGASTPIGYAINNTDCDDTNEGLQTLRYLYVDFDNDGIGSSTLQWVCSSENYNNLPIGYSLETGDCDDINSAVQYLQLYYVDADADGFGSGSIAEVCIGIGSQMPLGYSLNNSDCDDNDSNVWQEGAFYIDFDSDDFDNGIVNVCYGDSVPQGYMIDTKGVDCDDSNPTIQTPTAYYQDLDQDGYGSGALVMVCAGNSVPEGYSTNNLDCNDNNSSIYPQAQEICGNGIDENCNGFIDEGCLVSSQCGSVLLSLTQYIFANQVPGASQYKFEVTDQNSVREYTPPSGLRSFNFTQLGSVLYNTTYQVRVRYLRAGVWSDYGEYCTISTPAVPKTAVQNSQCGITLSSIASLISANTVNNALLYNFEIVNQGETFVYDSPTRNFYLTQVPDLIVNYDSEYQIRVKVLTTTGQWGEYGEMCQIRTPILQETKVQNSQCGATLLTIDTEIFAEEVSGASSYRFKVLRPDNSEVVHTTNNNSFRLTQLLGGVLYATTYNIQVATFSDGIWTPWGIACQVNTPVPFSKVKDAECGSSVPSFGTYITANQILGATRYRFQVTRGTEVREYTTTNSLARFALSQLSGTNYWGVTYSVEVAVEYGGSWRPYGVSCSISTPEVTTKVQTSQCGITLSSLTTIITANAISNASAYRFEITNIDGEVRTLDSNSRQFRLTQFNSTTNFITYASTYSIRVAVLSGGIWRAYGTACTLTTPALPATKVQTSQCDTTLATLSTNILADAVYGASAYRFEVTNGATVRTFETANAATNFFKLTQLTGGAMYSTTYSVRVAVKYGSGVWGSYGTSCNVTTPGVTTNVTPSQCGVTLASVSTSILAVAIADPLITAYRFEVTNGTTVRLYSTADGATSSFKLTQLSGGVLFNTAYSVRVAVKYNGLWQAYGASCTVTTPAVQTVKVISTQCGVMVQPSTTVMSEVAPVAATRYRFELTAGATVLTYENTINTFRLKDVPGYQMGTTYAVRVAYQYNGEWFAYGQSCNLTLPSLITKVQASICGTTVSTSTRIYTDALSATPSRYRFELTAGATVLTYENTINSFRFRDVRGYQSGTTYSVRVATQYNNVWYPYGESCIITVSATTREIAEEVPSKATIFAVKGYPNPYNAYFTLSLDTPSDAMVYVRVFDMTGKLIEDIEVAPSALESLQLGADWASGVYNVIVAQDDQVKTIRMIKKE